MTLSGVQEAVRVKEQMSEELVHNIYDVLQERDVSRQPALEKFSKRAYSRAHRAPIDDDSQKRWARMPSATQIHYVLIGSIPEQKVSGLEDCYLTHSTMPISSPNITVGKHGEIILKLDSPEATILCSMPYVGPIAGVHQVKSSHLYEPPVQPDKSRLRESFR